MYVPPACSASPKASHWPTRALVGESGQPRAGREGSAGVRAGDGESRGETRTCNLTPQTRPKVLRFSPRPPRPRPTGAPDAAHRSRTRYARVECEPADSRYASGAVSLRDDDARRGPEGHPVPKRSPGRRRTRAQVASCRPSRCARTPDDPTEGSMRRCRAVLST